MCFSSYKNCKLKLKLSWVRARERETSELFAKFILSEGKIFSICFFFSVYSAWLFFLNIYNSTYQKVFLHTLLLLVFKIAGRFQCILNEGNITRYFQLKRCARRGDPISTYVIIFSEEVLLFWLKTIKIWKGSIFLIIYFCIQLTLVIQFFFLKRRNQ